MDARARDGRGRRRPVAMGAALVAVGLASLAVTVALFGSLSSPGVAGAAPGRTPERKCPGPAHVGTSERAAGAVVEVFLRTAVVRHPESGVGRAARSACLPRKLTVPWLDYPRYETRFPRRVAAWFQLAPRIRNEQGHWEYAGFLHVSASDARPAAFQFLLELHGRRWLVSRFEVAPGSAQIDTGKMPT